MSSLGPDEADPEDADDLDGLLSIEEQLDQLRSDREQMRAELNDDS